MFTKTERERDAVFSSTSSDKSRYVVDVAASHLNRIMYFLFFEKFFFKQE